jgi:aconitate hydratase 2/2-methylisocitrate dehydratase
VYLASAELAAVAAIVGRLPTPEEYLEYAGQLDATAGDTYRYLNFDRLPEYVAASEKVTVDDDAYASLGPAMRAQLKKMAEEKKQKAKA